VKRILIALTLLAMASGVASAGIVVVDFFNAFAPGTSDDLIALPSSRSVNGVTFVYNSGLTASVDPTGVYGDTAGILSMNFASPVTGLWFNFAVYSVVPGDVAPADCALSGTCNLTVDFNPAGTEQAMPGTYDGGYDAGPAVVGSFAFSDPSVLFNQAVVTFNPVSDVSPYFFSIDTMSYDQYIPEPATFVLIGTALIGLGYGRRLAKRRR
jgi:hypothetical protein